MKKFRIRGALGGGFGGCENKEWKEIKAKDIDDAFSQAWLLACEEYDSYAGLHGLRDVEQIIEEDGASEDEAQEIYIEERESWIDYEAEEIE